MRLTGRIMDLEAASMNPSLHVLTCSKFRLRWQWSTLHMHTALRVPFKNAAADCALIAALAVQLKEAMRSLACSHA